MKKTSILTSLASLCLAFLLFPQTAQAAGFVQDSTGVKYQNDDGTFLKDSWVQVGQNIYHLDANGNVQTGWIQVGNLWYLLDANGVCTNPAGTAAPPAETAASAAPAADAADAAASATGNLFASAGWLPFSTADAGILNYGLSAGLVGFDGTQYWAAPAYVQFIDAQASQSAPAASASTAPAAPIAPEASAASAASAAPVASTASTAPAASAAASTAPAAATAAAPSRSAGNPDNFNTYNIPEQQQTSASYVLNKNTHKIHHPSCSSVAKIKPSNYAVSNLSVNELRAQGYTTCGICFK